MKKTCIMFAIFIAQTFFAQIISKDPTFASNGIFYTYSTSPYENDYLGELQNGSSSVFYIQGYAQGTANTNTNIYKTTSYAGPLDLTFGNGGIASVNYPGNYLASFLRRSDGKLNLLFNRYDAVTNIHTVYLVQLLPNGQLDPAFANNGVKIFPNNNVPIMIVNGDLNCYIKQQGSKILVTANEAVSGSLTYTNTYRLNDDGTLDGSFGNNGKLVAHSSNQPYLDNQNNVIIIDNNKIVKYTANGQLMTGFGNNGEVPFSDYWFSGSPTKIDSNNRMLYFSSPGLGIPSTLKRRNADGTLDTTFNVSTTAAHDYINDFYEKDGYYYIVGTMTINGSNPDNPHHTYYISRLHQDGALDTAFGEYIETDPNLVDYVMGKIKVLDNSIFVSGGLANDPVIIKYLFNTPTLSTTETVKNTTEITFENPIEHNLVYRSKEKIDMIEIYSADGRLLKTVKKNNSDISDLSKGVYVAKVTFENKKISTKKLIKE